MTARDCSAMQFGGWLDTRPHSVVSRPSTRILTLEMAILMGITAGRKTILVRYIEKIRVAR